jgi:hypothetical protein
MVEGHVERLRMVDDEMVLLLDAAEDVVCDKDTMESMVRDVNDVELVMVGAKLVNVDTEDAEDGR